MPTADLPAEVNDPPVIDYIKPTKMFQEPGRRLYVWETWRPDLASREYRVEVEDG